MIPQLPLKKRMGCPHCYKKTYVTLELGETCPNCGEVVGVSYWFQSKQIFVKGEGKWVRCNNEEQAKRMNEQGYKVKKIVQN